MTVSRSYLLGALEVLRHQAGLDHPFPRASQEALSLLYFLVSQEVLEGQGVPRDQVDRYRVPHFLGRGRKSVWHDSWQNPQEAIDSKNSATSKGEGLQCAVLITDTWGHGPCGWGAAYGWQDGAVAWPMWTETMYVVRAWSAACSGTGAAAWPMKDETTWLGQRWSTEHGRGRRSLCGVSTCYVKTEMKHWTRGGCGCGMVYVGWAHDFQINGITFCALNSPTPNLKFW